MKTDFAQSGRLMLPLLLFATFWNGLAAQPRAVCRKYIITDTLYAFRRDSHVAWDNKAYFPEYFYYDNLNELRGAASFDSAGQDFLWQKYLSVPARVAKDTTALFLRLKTRNIKSYTLYYFNIHSNNWLKRKTDVLFDGYQIPATEVLSDWENVDSQSSQLTVINGNQKSILAVSVEKRIDSNPFEFVVGDLILGYQEERDFIVKHPFFSWLNDKLVSENDRLQPPLRSNYFDELPNAMSDYNLSSRIYIVDPGKSKKEIQEREILKKIIESAIEYYPFFEEKKLNQAEVKTAVKKIFADKSLTDYCTLADSVSSFVKRVFDDLHFYLDKPKQGNCSVKSSPLQRSSVRIGEIDNKVYITGRFDTVYAGIDTGDELLEVDGIPVAFLIDSLIKTRYMAKEISPFKRYSIVNSILDRRSQDSCKIKTRKANNPDLIKENVLRYNIKYTVPANFRAVHGEVRVYNDFAYFRINSWDETVFLRFINEWEKISGSKGLVIDLRGNGGGELMAAMQLFSIFIDSPTVYLRFLNSQQQLDPVFIIPDKVYKYLSAKPVVLLGDQSTACASETFIKAMKNLRNVRYMSAGRTTGSLAAKFDIQLPSGWVVHVNGLQNKICYSGKYDVVENKGILPDKLVTIERVQDLRPYNDKLLKEALKLLSADNRDLPKTE